jgi:hypothetical protein
VDSFKSCATPIAPDKLLNTFVDVSVDDYIYSKKRFEGDDQGKDIIYNTTNEIFDKYGIYGNDNKIRFLENRANLE